MNPLIRNDIDATTIVMSIRWRYLLPLLAGTKTREFRTRLLPGHVRRVLTLPTGRPPAEHCDTPPGVLGMFDIDRQTWEPVYRWVQTLPRLGSDIRKLELVTVPGCGIDPEPLADYAGGYAENVAAIEVAGRPVRFPRPIPLDVLGVTRPPQSWCYAPRDWRSVLAAEVLLAA